MLVLWVFSGLMSMRPWGLTDSHSRVDLAALRQGALRADDFAMPVRQVMTRLAEEDGFVPVELQWQRLAGVTFVVARSASGESRLVEADAAPVRVLSK
ncbi:hypothetical protein N7592_07635 [Pseudomonas juntendi]|uniref:hypothetical protein n=1 Tax=Pseudomonas TaxID=286 RepID=UPI00114C8F92|nr:MULTISPECIES: hypothetical protein [Pseudomonas]MDG9873075.1 hypothetical protein [Pseudomonas juntendi]MDH0505374.1 hypothetical protein [Pseudomonas juntendi]MDH1042388.1 hypothetical protein [Pseudomonas juntendi]